MMILASASPRRRELLKLIIKDFGVEPSDADENTDITDPAEIVCSLAELKALDVAKKRPEDTVIGADTVVYCKGEILGKPKDKDDARRMINMLSGNTHRVYTGICVITEGKKNIDFCVTEVTFDELSSEERDNYLKSADIYDKAGAYAVQGEAAKFISKIEGCFYNVMGLPLNMLYRILKETDALTEK